MQLLDWIILFSTLLFIVSYGIIKTRKSETIDDYILGNKETRWWTVGISVMATQASAITFLSTPGQAFIDGMGFVQFYFGLPLAMVVICFTFIPIYNKLKIYTAYEYLEQRFDLKTRSLAAILFLIQRGLGTGLTIYAPAIILSTILGWNLNLLIIIIGFLVIIYTVSGGTKAVNVTQKQQMFVIFSGMFIAFFIILKLLPSDISFTNALQIAGANGKMDIVNFSFDPKVKYTFWSGIAGGFFLSLAYFGTDQSQVGRYLSGKSDKESQMGLIMNGLLKVPMQFFILLTGVMVFVFFQFHSAPLHFNPNNNKLVENSIYAKEYNHLENQLNSLLDEKTKVNLLYVAHLKQKISNNQIKEKLVEISTKEKELRKQAKDIIKKVDANAETNDKDYVFIHFILNYLPKGLIGLLLAVILSAAMSSSASGLSALGSTMAIDIYKRNVKEEKTDKHYVNATKFFTLFWGIIAIGFACLSSLFDNLIQLVNIVGSIFYGTVLGIFLVGFYIKFVKANAIFISGCISQITIILIYYFAIHIYPGEEKLSYLWLNFIGSMLTIVMAILIQFLSKKEILQN
ncbi:sodium:solute symporter [Flavobacterium sp.]|uniref:sodium:solute symporter n=1 Tax=Flavobacterium sp. TaxID=239 RepID=UPI00286D6BFD|nr:sodium:solute symporter [Flavobacterium sp.]